jgi:hypothetical protein
MMPWRKIAGLSVGVSLMVGCTITTSDGGDAGSVWDDTGGSGSQGGTSSTGGASTTGGTAAGGASTVVVCAPETETVNTCGYCLQSPDGTGMCSDYKVCAAVAGCTTIVNAMTLCMYGKTPDGGLVPAGADDACRAATPGMSAADKSDAAIAAQTLWNLITLGACDRSCYVEGT